MSFDVAEKKRRKARLERVAEELMGRRKWGSLQEIMMVGQDWRVPPSTAPDCALCSSSQCQHITIGQWEAGDSGGSSGGSSPGRMSTGPVAVLPPWYLKPLPSEDQPLDLSAKPPPSSSPGPSTQPPQPIKVPSPHKHIFKAKPRLSAVTGRRTYTEDELQAALRDIQSGKLGTRRAAVIYGIPRSTLRNKVYKLSQERRDAKEDEEEDELSGAEEEREVEKVLMKPLLSLEDVMRLSGDTKMWPYLQNLLSAGAEGASELLPRLPAELLRGMTEDRTDPGVILKVPSYRPVKPEPGQGPSVSATGSPKPESPGLKLPLDFRRDLQVIRNHNNNHVEERKTSPGVKPPTSSSAAAASAAAAAAAAAQGGKGTRPKRGKYRNYDRDSLVEAVRAVQRGEMSVHRAGSYYGVPHSTLEYKVKERHLMRPRKREPKPAPEDGTKRKDDSTEKRPPPPRPPITTPNGIKMPPIFDTPIAYPPFPFWAGGHFPPPVDYTRSQEMFATTQMMLRLQRDADKPPTLGKTAREMAESLYDGSGENGSFLDGIIRSSLETGLPAPKEGDKVLLEQLCRGGSLSEAEPPQSDSSDRQSGVEDPPTSPQSACDNTSTVHQSNESKVHTNTVHTHHTTNTDTHSGPFPN